MLRGGLKGKGFMGPSGSVVKDAKPQARNWGLSLLKQKGRLVSKFTTLFLSKVCRGDSD